MNAALKANEIWPPDTRLNDTQPCETGLGVQRALLTLRAIRQRYETGRDAHPDARGYSVQAVFDHGDMTWITAAIDALEKTTSRPRGPF